MQFELLLLDTTACPNCLWKIIGMFLLATLLGLLLGWIIWGRYRRQFLEASKERDNYKARFSDMEKEQASLKYQIDEQGKELDKQRTDLRKCEADKATARAQMMRYRTQLEAMQKEGGGDGDTVLSTGGGTVVLADTSDYSNVFSSDNLQIIEGIGPKIEQLLKDKGIANWGRLAESTVENLQTILAEAGDAFKMHNPMTWPDQARLANEGKWNELIALQRQLDGGRNDEGDGDTSAVVEMMYAKAIGFAKAQVDDLKIIEGIGPKIEELLKADGIANWKDLSQASVDRLNQILEAAGPSFRLAKPDSWPKQAEYAVNGQWAELKAYQDELTGGR